MAKKAVSEEYQANQQFRAVLEYQKVLLGLIDADVAARAGITGRTLTGRKADPGKFRLSEFRRLVTRMHLSARDVCAIIGVKYEAAER